MKILQPEVFFVCRIFLWAFQMGVLLDELEGTVKFLFQPAEESGHGSNYYVDHGCFEDIDAAMAMHVMNEIPKGTFSIDDGPAWHRAIDSSSRSMGDLHTAVRRIRAKMPSSLPQPLSWVCRPYPAA